MRGILLYSKKSGDRSSWAAVRGSKEVWISGMVGGDRVDIEYKDADGEIITDEVCAEGTGIVEDPEVRVNYSPWCPLTPETKIPVNHNMVVTILEPVPSLRDTYITNVQKLGGNVE